MGRMHSSADQDGLNNLLFEFRQLPLFEFLEKDTRPTCVISLREPANGERSNPTVVHMNQALKIIYPVLSFNLRQYPHCSRHLQTESTRGTFENLLANASDNEVFHYSDLTWTCVTINGNWRIISGMPASPHSLITSDYRSRSEPDSSNTSDHIAQGDQSDSGTSSSVSRVSDKLRTSALCSLMRFSNTISLQHCHLIEDSNWSKTSLGPRESWSSTTFQTVLHLLCSPEPCCTFWGSERTILYNEPYIALIKDFHPVGMSASAKIVFSEFWPQFEEICLRIERTRRPVKQDVYRALVDRSGVLEELYFSGTFMPILDACGQVCGIFNHTFEITHQIIAQRQMNALVEIGGNPLCIQTLDEYWKGLSTSMQQCMTDLPLMAIVSIDSDFILFHSGSSAGSGDPPAETWHLRSSYGFPLDALAPSASLSGSEIAAVLRFALKNEPVQLTSLIQQDGDLLKRLFGDCFALQAEANPVQCVVLPFTLSEEKPVACLILGINPLRSYDAEYRSFIGLVSRQLEGTATSIILQQKEKYNNERAMVQAEDQQRWLADQLIHQKREARQSESRFYGFARQAPVGVYILGQSGQIKFANDSFYKLLDIQSNNEDSEPWLPSIHPEDRRIADESWQSLRSGQLQSNFEYRVLRKSVEGERGMDVVYLRSSAFPEIGEDGTMKSVTGIVMDVTVHKAHEKAIADKMVHILEAKRAQENFMDMVSHEMRNPLSAMLQCAEEVSQLLERLSKLENISTSDRDSIEVTAELIDTIQWCGRHQRQIIDDVLTISKLDSELLALVPTNTTPISVIDRVVKIFASEIRAADIDLVLDTTSEANYKQCLMDSNRVLQIMINLVGNAVKFVKDRPTRQLNLHVTTSLSVPTGALNDIKFVPSGRLQRAPTTPLPDMKPVYVLFSVTDTGPGLTPAEMESLFARFKQASPRTHAQYGGTGLGLYISRELAEMHGGEIGLSSEANQGSCFVFYIKAYQVSDATSAQRTDNTVDSEYQIGITNTRSVSNGLVVPLLQLTPSEITILIVEDNLINQKVLNRQLKKLGFQTITTNNGQEALDVLRSSRWRRGENEDKTNPAKRKIRKEEENANISIVLCDLEMPVMDGLTCVRHIRQWKRDKTLKAHIPVVAVTGNARAEQVQGAKDAGFDEVVCKPYSVPDLVPIIQKLVALHHL